MSRKLFVIGKAGSGKDYIINILKRIEPEYMIVKIAEPLYRLIALIKKDNLVDARLVLGELEFDEDTSKIILSSITRDIDYNSLYLDKPRQPLQVAGDVIRKYNYNALIAYACKEAMKHRKALVGDVRLKSEADYLSSNGFIGLKINANDETRYYRLKLRDGKYNNSDLNHNTELEVNRIAVKINIYNEIDTDDSTIIYQLKNIKDILDKDSNIA